MWRGSLPPFFQEVCRMNSRWLIVWLCKRIPHFLYGSQLQTAHQKYLERASLPLSLCVFLVFKRQDYFVCKLKSGLTIYKYQQSYSSKFSVLNFVIPCLYSTPILDVDGNIYFSPQKQRLKDFPAPSVFPDWDRLDFGCSFNEGSFGVS